MSLFNYNLPKKTNISASELPLRSATDTILVTADPVTGLLYVDSSIDYAAKMKELESSLVTLSETMSNLTDLITLQSQLNNIISSLNNKVDSIPGKTLTDFNFSQELKSKLEQLPTFDGIAIKEVDNSIHNITPIVGSFVIDLSSFAKKSDISKVYRPMGSVSFANLPSLVSAAVGDVYNITDEFVTNSSFLEASNKVYPAGTNVVCISLGEGDTKRWDVLSGYIDFSNYASNSSVQSLSNAVSTFQSNLTVLENAIGNKQERLSSGVNIKTINGNSILGSGNINIQTSSPITLDNSLDMSSENPVKNKAIAQAISIEWSE